MATAAELRARRDALTAQRSSGVARVSYDGKAVDYRRGRGTADRWASCRVRHLSAIDRAPSDDLSPGVPPTGGLRSRLPRMAALPEADQ
jgi:hypothetical protein